MTNEDQFFNNDMKYSRSLVSFIDILGFRNIINTEIPNKIFKIIRNKDRFNLNNVFQNLFYPPKNRPDTFIFSDLIVNVSNIDPYDKDGELVYLIHNTFRYLGFIQSILAIEGVFVRGGICIGDIFVHERTIFGPALVRSYELESTVAKWPIIAIDESLVSEIRDKSAEYVKIRFHEEGAMGRSLANELISEIRTFIRRTTDGIAFLDYLECLAYEDSTTGDLQYYLRDHKSSVLNAYDRYRHYKYNFIAEYHDKKCREYKMDSEHLLIGKLS